MTRHVLIISPRFPPINAPDHQRVRMSLPYFEQWGWQPTILTVDPVYINGVCDPLLAKTVPPSIEVISTPALPRTRTRWIGLGTIDWRCLPYIAEAGTQLLKHRHFDLIYFSTTAFPTFSLALLWHQRFQSPYVIDFQDPWLSDYYSRTHTSPPGGWLKYGINQLVARILEPKVVRKASHIISVSPEYPKVLCKHYPWLRPEHCSELPFGAPKADFEILPSLGITQTVFNPDDGYRHWVYVGRCGSDIMSTSLYTLFFGMYRLRQNAFLTQHKIKLHFVGTSYAPPDRAVKTVEPIAAQLGLSDLVEERTQRIPYFEALQVLVESDAILLMGSDDPGYTASKLYPCVLAQKPILAIFHQASSVVKILQQCQAGAAVTFETGDRPQDLLPMMEHHLKQWLNFPEGYQPQTNWRAFQAYTAVEMTRKQCEIFDACIE